MSSKRDWYWWRLPATGFCFIVFGLAGIVMSYLLLPLISLFSRDEAASTQRCRRLIQLGFKSFVTLMRRLRVIDPQIEGEELLQAPGQLVIANHPSLIDIVVLLSIMPNAACIIKADLYQNVFMRGSVRRARYICNSSPEQLLEDCLAELEAGTSLVVFPEGTRTVPGQGLRFRRGAAYVWLRSQCPVALVRIGVSPPMLAKGEKWHQIPYARPVFRLQVLRQQPGQFDIEANEEGRQARALTQQWQHYFKEDIAA